MDSDTLQTMIWALTVLAIAMAGLWRFGRMTEAVKQGRVVLETAQAAEDEVVLLERRTAALLAEGTLEAQIAYENACLGRKEAEEKVGAELAADLKDIRLAAEQQVIAARIAAEVELAPEFARKSTDRSHFTPMDLVEAYGAYMENVPDGSTYLEFDEFVKSMPSL